MGEIVRASDFDRLMCSVLKRMGVSLFDLNTKGYQIRFKDEAVFFIGEKLDGWFEISTEVGKFSPQVKGENVAQALLSLQLEQGVGPLVGMGLHQNKQAIYAYMRLHAAHCDAEDVLCGIQTVRIRSVEASRLLG